MRLETMRDKFVNVGIPAKVYVCVGSAIEEILAFSDKGDASLIILKSIGERGFLNTLGSTTTKVARNTQIPVLVLKRSAIKTSMRGAEGYPTEQTALGWDMKSEDVSHSDGISHTN